MFISAGLYPAEVTTDPESWSQLRRDSSFFQSRSQHFVNNRTRCQAKVLTSPCAHAQSNTLHTKYADKTDE